MPKITVAKSAGFCFGVKNALDLVLKQKEKTNIFGFLIHNSQVVEELNQRGINSIEKLEDATANTIVITAHGVSDSVRGEIKKQGFNIIDATCPLVKALHEKAKLLEKQGCFIIILGDKEHIEVRGIADNLTDKLILQDAADLNKNAALIRSKEKIGIVVQTTQDLEEVTLIVNEIKKLNPPSIFYNTICSATKERQQEAKELAKNSDIMIVIGGHHSANTNRLAQICSKITETKHIETANELKPEWFKNKEAIGVTAGASTPEKIIKETLSKIEHITSLQN